MAVSNSSNRQFSDERLPDMGNVGKQNPLPRSSDAQLESTLPSQLHLAHLQSLAKDEFVVKGPELAFGDPDLNDEDPEGYQQGSFSREILGGCKSWLTSMLVHLAVILLLALLTMKTSVNQTVSIEMANDDYSGLMDIEELEFDTAEFQSFDEAEVQEFVAPQELLEFQPDADLAELDDVPMDMNDPLASESNQMQRLSREMTSEELMAGGGSSSFFGIDASGDSIVYIVDRSGSMQGARWRDATTELLKSVNSLRPEQKFYVFLFSDNCHPMPQMEGRDKLVAATGANKQRFTKWLAKQAPDDSTKPLSSIRRGMNMQPDSMFLLTDGQFYDNTGDYLLRHAQLQAKRSDPDDLTINTIAFYCEPDLETMLNEIALAFNGTFRSIQ